MGALGRTIVAHLVLLSLTAMLGLSADLCSPDVIVGANYPREARGARIEGIVRISLLITADGRVIGTTAASGHPVLRKFVESELREWRFPSANKCSAVEMQWIFKLNGYCEHAPNCKERFLFKSPNIVELTSEMPGLQP